jgi:hypothetical protein
MRQLGKRSASLGHCLRIAIQVSVFTGAILRKEPAPLNHLRETDEQRETAFIAAELRYIP